MEQKSRRHHYLPQFYIKKFCNIDGSIYINKKTNEKNYNNVKKQFPKGIFFEWDRNTYEINEKQSDVIEKLYGYIEDKIAPHLEKIIQSENNSFEGVDVETFRNIIFLGYIIKWRIPKSDHKAAQINAEVPFSKFNLHAKFDDYLLDIEDLTTEEISRELKRILLAGSLFSDTEIYNEVFKNCFVISLPYPLLLTDNPFIELPSEHENEVSSFIFPLSSSLLLVSCPFVDKYELAEELNDKEKNILFCEYLYKSVQITLMWHAQKLVGCKDERYLKSFLAEVLERSENLEQKNFFPPMVVFDALKNYKDFFKVVSEMKNES